jgi:hypothetical protein
LRGPDGQPAEQNIKLARLLMRAVFDAGHAPFVPHLLFPQVLSENEADLKRSFEANYRWLDVCDEVWVYADDELGLSRGMALEVKYVLGSASEAVVRFMPPEFEAVRAAFEHEQLTMIQHIAHCEQCQRYTGLNSQKLCLECFAGGTPA